MTVTFLKIKNLCFSAISWQKWFVILMSCFNTPFGKSFQWNIFWHIGSDAIYMFQFIWIKTDKAVSMSSNTHGCWTKKGVTLWESSEEHEGEHRKCKKQTFSSENSSSFVYMMVNLSKEVVHSITGCLVVVTENPQQPQDAYLRPERMNRWTTSYFGALNQQK